MFTHQELVEEIMFEYNYSKESAERLITAYESTGLYNALCDIVKYHKHIIRKE